ncbi:MAG: AarF/ABC1/UbiB kinase family protein [Myxococcales bacterium]|nr:AarF/ABC1/UbiB kinase family protein [Myxococcales bacterium]
MKTPRLRQSIMARSSKLMGMAARIAGHEITQQVGDRLSRTADNVGAQKLALRVKQAKILTESLSELKGAAMKAGQMLSIDASDFLPPEAVQILTKLQGEGSPIPFEAIVEVLKEELGPDAVDALQGLSQQPVASASIGQVHSARVGDTEVAIKVQYPGIAESIDSDLNMLKRLASTWLSFSRRPIQLDGVFEELKTTLELEANYLWEAECINQYRKHLSDHPLFIVPAPYSQFSSSRVLTLEWISGLPLGKWISLPPSLAERRRVAEALLELYCQEFLQWGFVQTDPNPANYIITPDGRIGLLDFGACLNYSADFRRDYLKLVRLLPSASDEAIVEAGIEFGVLDEREEAEPRELFVKMMKAAIHPFDEKIQPFAFRDPDYQKQARQIVFSFLQVLRYTAPPRKLIFLHRKLGGLFNILKRLDVSINLRDYWERMVEHPWVFEETVQLSIPTPSSSNSPGANADHEVSST